MIFRVCGVVVIQIKGNGIPVGKCKDYRSIVRGGRVHIVQADTRLALDGINRGPRV